MPLPPSILCYGRDSILVETRQRILERVGFACAIAHNSQELKFYLEVYAIDVLIICHSVPAEDCEEAKWIAHHQVDPTLVLLLNQGDQKCNEGGTDASFETRQGPKALVQRITALLKAKGQGSEARQRKKPLPSGLQERHWNHNDSDCLLGDGKGGRNPLPLQGSGLSRDPL